jgi:uncharacterized protein (DUF2147 family)
MKCDNFEGTKKMTYEDVTPKAPKAVLAILMFAIFITLQVISAAMAADAPKPTSQADSKRLIGHWDRPDGGYILEINEILKNGKLKAAYYNPRPINVSRSEFSRKDGSLMVYIELRDVNYPGSKYNLKYDPKSDKLIGTYFQAVMGQTYNVEFVRFK